MTHCLPVNHLPKSENVLLLKVLKSQIKNTSLTYLMRIFGNGKWKEVTHKHCYHSKKGEQSNFYVSFIFILNLCFTYQCLSPHLGPFRMWALSCFPTHPLIHTSSHVSSCHADNVISVIIYLLMQTWPCPRYAVRQKYSYCSHCETNKEWDRRDINYCSTATIFHISLSSLSTHHITHSLMHVCLTCVFSNGYTYKKGTLFHSVTYIWIRYI